MKSTTENMNVSRRVCILCAVACAWAVSAQQPESKAAAHAAAATYKGPRAFATAEQAADALVDAAERFDVVALTEIFGPAGKEVVLSGEFAQDRKHATDFAGEARQKKSVSVDPKSGSRAFLLVGNEDWPFPVPLVHSGGKWSFDGKAGLQELLY